MLRIFATHFQSAAVVSAGGITDARPVGAEFAAGIVSVVGATVRGRLLLKGVADAIHCHARHAIVGAVRRGVAAAVDRVWIQANSPQDSWVKGLPSSGHWVLVRQQLSDKV